MAASLESGEVISSLLLVKAVLAVLAVLIFAYYKFYWEKAKHHLQVHFFYAKWRAVRHAVALGVAAVGFAIGFTVELFGTQLGLSANMARFVSSVFEIGSLFSMLFVFFNLALEDVPHFQHIAEAARHHHRHPQSPGPEHEKKEEAATSKPMKRRKAKKRR